MWWHPGGTRSYECFAGSWWTDKRWRWDTQRMRVLRIIMWIACGILVLFGLAGMGGGAMGPQELAIMNVCMVVLIVGGVAFLIRRRGA